MKKIILILTILNITLNSFAQTNLKVVFEGVGMHQVSNYGKYGTGKTSLVRTQNYGVFITHPSSTKLYQCDKVLGKNCDIFKRDFLILQKDKKYGVIDFDGKEIYSIKSELMPQYECDTKKWIFVKPVESSNNENIQMDSFQELRAKSNNPELEEFLKKYKYVHSFNNGYYWVSEDGEYDEKGGGLISSDMEWIIPMSNDYWFKDYENLSYFEIIPTNSKYLENPDEEAHIILFETGKRVFSRKNRLSLKIKGDKLIYRKSINPNDIYETQQAVYDLALQKELALLQYDVLNIIGNLLIVAEKNWDIGQSIGLYSLIQSKIVLPIEYKEIEVVNERYIIGTDYTNINKIDTYKFKIFERENQSGTLKK
jgi:hypothetical protein